MNKTDADKLARQVFEEWMKECDEIEKKAKENGTWCPYGLDSNNHLFKEANQRVKERLEKIKKAEVSG